VWLVSQIVADSVNASNVFACVHEAVLTLREVSFIIILKQSGTGINGTDRIINQLIRVAAQTLVFLVIFALAALFGFLFDKKSNLWALFAQWGVFILT
jgi:hypothetical protein